MSNFEFIVVCTVSFRIKYKGNNILLSAMKWESIKINYVFVSKSFLSVHF